MNPINLSQVSENKVYCNRTNAQSCNNSPSFKGLNQAMGKTIYASPELLQRMLGVFTREKSCVGSLPKEMIAILREKCKTPAEVGQKISMIKSTFAEVADSLREMDLEEFKYAHSQEAKEFDEKALLELAQNIGEFNEEALLEISENPSIEALEIFNKKIEGAQKLPKEFVAKLEKTASKFLTASMKKIGLIPKNGKVQVNHLGGGHSGNAYKISFLNGTDEKLFHDKVLKVYRDPNTQIMDEYEREFIENEAKSMAKSYGVGPEANIALYLRKAIKHSLKETDLITPHFFDLEHGIALMDMSDNELPAITKHIDFEKLGLVHTDLDRHDGNRVLGRIVDFGGIEKME